MYTVLTPNLISLFSPSSQPVALPAIIRHLPSLPQPLQLSTELPLWPLLIVHLHLHSFLLALISSFTFFQESLAFACTPFFFSVYGSIPSSPLTSPGPSHCLQLSSSRSDPLVLFLLVLCHHLLLLKHHCCFQNHLPPSPLPSVSPPLLPTSHQSTQRAPLSACHQ